MPGLRHRSMVEVNEFLVLDFIRERGDTTRPEIARELAMSAASVSRLVHRLRESGLIQESEGSAGGAGRPRSRISFNPGAGAVVAVDLGGTRCHGALADLGGSILAEDVRPTRDGSSAYATLRRCIDRLRAESAERGLPVAAIAIGVPAIVDAQTGRAIGGPNVDWQGFDLLGRLAKDVDVPFTVENDVDLAALAQAWRGEARHLRDFVTLSIGTGIGAAAVVDGRLVKGHHNAAGEVGYMVLTREQLAEPGAGGLGGFERVATGPAIARRAATLLRASPDGSVLAPDSVSPQAVFEAAARGDRVAGAAIDELLDYVSIAVIALVGAFDPAAVIFDGGVGRSLEPYLGDIAARVGRHAPLLPEFRVSRLGPNATVLGAIGAALQLARRRQAPSAAFGAITSDQMMPRRGEPPPEPGSRLTSIRRSEDRIAPEMAGSAAAGGQGGRAAASREDRHTEGGGSTL